MRVLVACEFSGIVRDAFRREGHEAWSCDTAPPETIGEYSDYHIMNDVSRVLLDDWDLMIAHPPCTYLANSGVRWLRRGKVINEDRWALLEDAAAFFLELLNAPIDKICIENPLMHEYAATCIGRRYSQIVHPWQHGHEESKTTCLWLENLPRLKPTKVVSRRRQKVHYMSPGPDRSRERSKTYTGIATAMADQWGRL
jgi:hypothetical protein